MIKLVWRHRHITTRSHLSTGSTDVSALPSTVTSDVNLSSNAAVEKMVITNTRPKPKSAWRWNWKLTPKADDRQTADPEKDGSEEREPRPMRLYAPFYCGLAVAMSICKALSLSFLGSFPQLISPRFSLHRQWNCRLARRVGFRQQLSSVCPSRHGSISILRRVGRFLQVDLENLVLSRTKFFCLQLVGNLSLVYVTLGTRLSCLLR